jgi:hypothetical protein
METSTIFTIIALILLGWWLDHLRRKNLAMRQRMKHFEDFLSSSYRYRVDITFSIDWIKFFYQINPQKSSTEIKEFVKLFRDDESTLISIDTIRWKYETDSIFWLSSLREEIEHWRKPITLENIRDRTYQGIGYRGFLFGRGENYKKYQDQIRDIFQYTDTLPEEIYNPEFPFPFILHPEKIGFSEKISGIQNLLVSSPTEEITISYSEIPFSTLIQTCIDQRFARINPDKIIDIVRKKRSAYTYSLSFFEAMGNSPESFEFTSGAVKVSVHIDIARADTSF